MDIKIAETSAPEIEAPADPNDVSGVAGWLQSKQEAETVLADDETDEPDAAEPDTPEEDEGDDGDEEDEDSEADDKAEKKSRSALRREKRKREIAEAKEQAERLGYELTTIKAEAKHLGEQVSGWQEHAQTWEATARNLKSENDFLRQMMEQNGISEDPRDQEIRRLQYEHRQTQLRQEQAQMRAHAQADAQMRAEVNAAGVEAMHEAKRYGIDAQEVMRTWGAHRWHGQNIPVVEVAKMVAFRHGKLGPKVLTADEIRAQQQKNQSAPVTQRAVGLNAKSQFDDPTPENAVAYLQSRGVI